MKKKLTILIVAAVLAFSTTFAKGTNDPSPRVQTEFKTVFVKAKEVKWEKVSNLFKASFIQGEQYLSAYFAPDGRMVGLSRNISINSLPLILQKGIQIKLSSHWVSESFEVFGINGTEYFVTLENAKEQSIFKATGDEWAIYRTVQKD